MSSVGALWSDARYALRALLAQPTITAVAVTATERPADCRFFEFLAPAPFQPRLLGKHADPMPDDIEEMLLAKGIER